MQRIGWIGTGIMGRSMCSHLLDAGYKVTAYNRTLEKAKVLESKGAVVVTTAAQVATASDIVFLIVGYPSDVREICLHPESGVLAHMKPDSILVDMTTSSPSLAKELHDAAKAKGIHAIDAPVSGGDIGARDGTLSIMIGGAANAIERVQPMFDLMGKNIRPMGETPGSGQHTKMVNQILISTMMIGVVEGMLYASAAGLDPLKVIEAVGSGAAGSWSINVLGPRIAKRDFEPGFMVEHFLKDMGIAIAEANRMGLSLPGLALANQFYMAVQAQGYGRKGTQALMLALEQMNGIDKN